MGSFVIGLDLLFVSLTHNIILAEFLLDQWFLSNILVSH